MSNHDHSVIEPGERCPFCKWQPREGWGPWGLLVSPNQRDAIADLRDSSGRLIYDMAAAQPARTPVHPEEEEVSEIDEARVRLYAQAMYDSHGLRASDYCIRNDRDFWQTTALATIAVADEEQAALRAEVERLTRECLDREATETDARERLRRCEERLAIAQAIAKTATDALPSPTFAQDERWNDGLDGQGLTPPASRTPDDPA